MLFKNEPNFSQVEQNFAVHVLTEKDVTELAQDRPFWSLLAASRAMH